MSILDSKPLRFTVNKFPESIAIKEASGLLWGMVVQPLLGSKTTKDLTSAESIARCVHCYGFINPYCSYQYRWWVCSLCGTRNGTSESGKRYLKSNPPIDLFELRETCVDYELPVNSLGLNAENNKNKEIKSDSSRIVHIAVVDETGSEEFFELITSSILAALEALPDTSWIGLMTFSDRIGLYDLLSDIPHVRYVPIDDTNPMNDFFQTKNTIVKTECRVPLGDVVPIDDFIVEVGPNRQRIITAIESLCHRGESESPKRALGTTIEELMKMVFNENVHPDEFNLNDTLLIRCFLFINGIPNYGIGSLSNSRYKETNTIRAEELMHPNTKFYQDIATIAAESSFCFDIFAVSELSYMDLASLYPLTSQTGGNLLLYTTSTEATLPQDLFRQLHDDHAFNCLLRIRTSMDFHIKEQNVYGHLKRDHKYENLWHISGCNTHKSFSFDFDFDDPECGFSYTGNTIPIIQMSFAYTKAAPNKEIKRYLKVYTTQIRIARDPMELMRSVDIDCTMILLCHKAMEASKKKGLKETKLLVQDWLTTIIIQYNLLLVQSNRASDKIDVFFEQCRPLKSLFQLVFGLLNSDLLQETHIHPDVRIFHQSIYSSMDPRFISTALYPHLIGFENVNIIKNNSLPLSRYAMNDSQCSIFLLDAYTKIYVYYVETNKSLPFPPPQQSLLRNLVNEAKKQNHVAPRISFMIQDTLEARYFDALLIDDQAYVGGNFENLVEEIKSIVLDEISIYKTTKY